MFIIIFLTQNNAKIDYMLTDIRCLEDQVNTLCNILMGDICVDWFQVSNVGSQSSSISEGAKAGQGCCPEGQQADTFQIYNSSQVSNFTGFNHCEKMSQNVCSVTTPSSPNHSLTSLPIYSLSIMAAEGMTCLVIPSPPTMNFQL